MTHITVTYGADTLRLTARGHATGAPAACAAVSALLYALEGTLPLPLGEVPPQGAERACSESHQALSVACGDSLRPALPHLPFPDRHQSRSANGAAAEIPGRLPLPPAAAWSQFPC